MRALTMLFYGMEDSRKSDVGEHAERVRFFDMQSIGKSKISYKFL